MSALNDATCKCGKRIGWAGRMVDRPACPRCGYRPPQAELEDADREMDEFIEMLSKRKDVSNERRQQGQDPP